MLRIPQQLALDIYDYFDSLFIVIQSMDKLFSLFFDFEETD